MPLDLGKASRGEGSIENAGGSALSPWGTKGKVATSWAAERGELSLDVCIFCPLD